MMGNSTLHTRYKRINYLKRNFTAGESRKSLWDHWNDLAGKAPSHKPYKKDLSLLALGRAIPSTILRKRIAPKNVEIRLIGEKIDVLKFGRVTGKNLFDVIRAEHHRLFEYLFDNICTKTVGFSVKGEFITPSGEIYLVKSLMLPLLGDDNKTNYVISCHDIFNDGFFKGDHSKLGEHQINIIKVTPIDLGFGVPNQFKH